MVLASWTNQQVFDQLNSGSTWSAASITFSFPTSASAVYATSGERAGFAAFNTTQQNAARLALSTWGDLISRPIVEVSPGNSYQSSDIEFAMTSSGSGYAHTYLPDGGSIWFNSTYTTGTNSLTAPVIGRHGFYTYVHELGHAFGLEHMGNYDGVGTWTPSSYQDSTVYSVMSYFGPNWGSGTSSGEGLVAWADWRGSDGVLYAPQTPMLNDVFVLQALYGASTTTRTEDTTYGFNSTISGAAAALYDFSLNRNPILTIFDSAGIDTLDLSGWTGNTTIDLNPGAFSSGNAMTNNVGIAFGCDIENGVGGSGSDTITGNALDNELTGGAGNDTITGGAGSDTVNGGEGSDIYLVLAASDHPVAEFADSGTTGTDEVRFAAATASTLTLFAGDTGIERAVIGTGTAASAVTSGTVANGIDASALATAITLVGNAGANALAGGAGDDTLTGGAGIDVFAITAGTDRITDLGMGGADVFTVAAGATVNATVTAAWTASAATVNQGSANIVTNGLAVNLAAVATAGGAGFQVTNTGAAAALTGSAFDDRLTGGAGNDTITGGAGSDTVNGGEGSDIYLVLAASDHPVAEFADSGTTGTDEVRFAAATASTLTLFAGDTGIERAVIGTGTAASAVTSGTVANGIDASALATAITLVGNAGANALAGGAGDDTLTGGLGRDTLTGGDGADQFVFNTSPNSTTNFDTIVDFVAGTDRLVFSKAVFTGFASAAIDTLSADAFWSGAGVTAAHDATDRIVYNTTTGVVYYDADGLGGVGAIQVALLGTSIHPALGYDGVLIVA